VDVVEEIRERGDFAPCSELSCASSTLQRLVADGTLRRPRRGWYSTAHPTDPRFRAVAIGGRLTGASALRELGAWMLDPPTLLHVAVPRTAARLRSYDPAGVRVHWGRERDAPISHAIVGVRDALLRVVLDEEVEMAVACLDWAFATGRLDRFGFETILRALPATARVIRQWVDPRSQSVLESVARVRLLGRGWSVETQQSFGDLRSVDLLVEGQVALELDGWEWHRTRFHEDREKDLAAAAGGWHVLRVSAPILRTGWPHVESAIEAALAARRNGDGGNSGKLVPIPRGRKLAPGTDHLFA
jgi:very-short-patch-repair endonuclease